MTRALAMWATFVGMSLGALNACLTHIEFDPPTQSIVWVAWSECLPPCCVEDFEAGVATRFPPECWDAGSVER